MLWLYLTALALLLGAEVNAEIEHAAARHGATTLASEPEPEPTPVAHRSPRDETESDQGNRHARAGRELLCHPTGRSLSVFGGAGGQGGAGERRSAVGRR